MARTFPGTLSGGFADDYLENSSTAWIDTPPFSLVAWVYWTEAAALPESVLGMNNDGNPQVRFQLNITTGYLQCWISDGTNIPTVVDTVKFPVSTWTHIGVTIEAGSPGTARLWKNGSNIASDTATNIASGAWGMTYSFLAEWPFGGSHYYEFEGSIALVAAYDVALSSTDFTDLYTRKKHPLLVKPQNLVGLPNLRGTGNAGGIIGPTLTEAGTVTESNDPPGIIYPSGPIFVVPGVAGGTTIDRQPGAGALTLAGQTPSVSFTFDRAPAAGALTIAGQTPSTALAIDRAPAAGALTLTGQAPTIAFVFDRAPAAGTLTLAGAAPATVLAFVRAPGAGALTIAGQTPTVGVALDIQPSAGALTLAGQTPSIALDLRRAPGAGALTIAGQTPTVNTSIDRQPSAGALTLAGQTPSIALDFRRAPGAGALTLAGQTPVVSLGSDVVRQPGAGALTLTGQAPSIALDFRRAPGAGALTITGQTPSVTRAIDRQPGAGSLTLAGATPSISFNFVRSPAAGALTLAGLVPTVQSEPEAAPTPTPTGNGAGEAAGGGPFPGRRRREDERLPTSRTYGPTLEEDEETEEQAPSDLEARARLDIESQIAELETLRTALTEDSDRVVALEGQLDDIDLRITELQQEKQMFLLLLLLIE